MQYVTISTMGNAQDFGDAGINGATDANGASNSVRGVFGGGDYPGVPFNAAIDYITIASLGDSLDFGDLTVGRGQVGAFSSPSRCCWAGGETPSLSDVIDYVTIATLGDATDFGNLTAARRRLKNGCSDSHGGLG